MKFGYSNSGAGAKTLLLMFPIQAYFTHLFPTPRNNGMITALAYNGAAGTKEAVNSFDRVQYEYRHDPAQTVRCPDGTDRMKFIDGEECLSASLTDGPLLPQLQGEAIVSLDGDSERNHRCQLNFVPALPAIAEEPQFTEGNAALAIFHSATPRPEFSFAANGDVYWETTNLNRLFAVQFAHPVSRLYEGTDGYSEKPLQVWLNNRQVYFLSAEDTYTKLALPAREFVDAFVFSPMHKAAYLQACDFKGDFPLDNAGTVTFRCRTIFISQAFVEAFQLPLDATTRAIAGLTGMVIYANGVLTTNKRVEPLLPQCNGGRSVGQQLLWLVELQTESIGDIIQNTKEGLQQKVLHMLKTHLWDGLYSDRSIILNPMIALLGYSTKGRRFLQNSRNKTWEQIITAAHTWTDASVAFLASPQSLFAQLQEKVAHKATKADPISLEQEAEEAEEVDEVDEVDDDEADEELEGDRKDEGGTSPMLDDAAAAMAAKQMQAPVKIIAGPRQRQPTSKFEVTTTPRHLPKAKKTPSAPRLASKTDSSSLVAQLAKAERKIEKLERQLASDDVWSKAERKIEKLKDQLTKTEDKWITAEANIKLLATELSELDEAFTIMKERAELAELELSNMMEKA